MKILFYTTQSDPIVEPFHNVIAMFSWRGQVDLCRTLECLQQRLCRPSNDLDIVVLIAANREELLQIHSLGDLLLDLRIVLILPDRNPGTISKAHALGPRFLTYLDSDSEELKSVLSKMLENQNSR